MTAAQIQTAEDVSLHTLDGQGVFFTRSRQELYIFNTPATFIWLAVEDGLTAEAIVQEYAQAFGLAEADAVGQVQNMLVTWQRQGYLWTGAFPETEALDFNTALGRLLINPVLRSEFVRAPLRVAELMPISPEDRVSLLALNLEDLEAQAKNLSSKRLSRRHRAWSRFKASAQYADPGEHSGLGRADGPEYHCRLLDTHFSVRTAPSLPAGEIGRLLGHLNRDLDHQAKVVELEVLQANGQIVLLEEGLPPRQSSSLENTVPMIHAALRRTAVNRHDFMLQIHAGVVARHGVCTLLPAQAGSGKTTLTAALISNGYQYFSDEIALIEMPGFRVRPFPISLTVKPGSINALGRLYPELARLPSHVREDGITVRYLSPALESLPASLDEATAVRRIIFPRYDADAETTLRPLAKADALQRLLDECLVIPLLLEQAGISELVRLFEHVACYELVISNLETAVRAIDDLDS